MLDLDSPSQSRKTSVIEASIFVVFILITNFIPADLQRGWKVEGSKLVFAPLLDDDESEISAVKVISNTLTYARELERIV